MSEKSCLPFVLGDIHNSDVVSVDVNGFITNNQLFVVLVTFSVTKHKDVGVSKIKFVLPFRQESVLLWIFLVHSDDEESKFFFELVSQNVEDSILMIIDNLFHAPNLVEII